MAVGTFTSFAAQVQVNLDFWLVNYAYDDEAQYAELDDEWPGIHRAIDYGIRNPASWLVSSSLLRRMLNYVDARGHAVLWFSLFERTLARCPAGELDERGKLLNCLGDLNGKMDKFEAALGQHEAALALGLEAGNKLTQAIALQGIAASSVPLRRYEGLDEYCLRAAELLAEVGDPFHLIPTSFNQLGMLEHARGNYETAVAWFHKAIHRFRATHQPRRQAQHYINLSLSCIALHQYAEANAALLQALEQLPSTAGPSIVQVNIQNSLGTLFYFQEDYEKALHEFLAIDARYLEEFGHLSSRAYLANNLGNNHLKLGRYEQAIQQLTYAISLWLAMEDASNLGNSTADLAETYVRMGDPEKGLAFYYRAADVLEPVQDNAWARQLRAKVLRCIHQLEINGRLD